MIWVARVGAAFLALLLCGFVAERIAEARDNRRFPAPGRLVPIGDGRTLHILCAGKGPTVIVEQGAGEPAILWRRIQQGAASFARICLYDRAGYGWSPPARADQTVDERAADLHRLLEAASIPGPYIIVAHSYGGLIARAFARAHPEEIRALVMVDAIEESIAFHPNYLAFLRRSRPFVGAMRIAAAAGIIRLASLFGGDDESSADPESRAIASSQSARPSFFTAIAGDLRSIEAASAAHPLPEGFGSLGDIPVIAITHGKAFPGPFAALEPIWLPGQERWVRLTSHGRLVHAHDAGHLIAMDSPELVIAALRSACADGSSAEERSGDRPADAT